MIEKMANNMRRGSHKTFVPWDCDVGALLPQR